MAAAVIAVAVKCHHFWERQCHETDYHCRRCSAYSWLCLCPPNAALAGLVVVVPPAVLADNADPGEEEKYNNETGSWFDMRGVGAPTLMAVFVGTHW